MRLPHMCIAHVLGAQNPADLLTQHLDQAKRAQCLAAMSLRAESGRAGTTQRHAADAEAFLAPVVVGSPQPTASWPASAGACRALCGLTSDAGWSGRAARGTTTQPAKDGAHLNHRDS